MLARVWAGWDVDTMPYRCRIYHNAVPTQGLGATRQDLRPWVLCQHSRISERFVNFAQIFAYIYTT
jgi:hypothetical protein